MKVVAIIPAHLHSVRLPRKILLNLYGLPMIEHVRRRALLSRNIDEVYIATPDQEIADIMATYDAQVIMTSNVHKNGTSRVAEAVKSLDCSHVLLLQGDEPLLLPDHLDSMVQAIKNDPVSQAWNATASINSESELDLHSFVKCALAKESIIHCFRKTPYFSPLEKQQQFVRKILGIIAYQKDFLVKLSTFHQTPIEDAEFIEQMRIIENGYKLMSVAVDPSLPSINEPHEVDIVKQYIESNPAQQNLLEAILNE